LVGFDLAWFCLVGFDLFGWLVRRSVGWSVTQDTTKWARGLNVGDKQCIRNVEGKTDSRMSTLKTKNKGQHLGDEMWRGKTAGANSRSCKMAETCDSSATTTAYGITAYVTAYGTLVLICAQPLQISHGIPIGEARVVTNSTQI
jgi:hypothetical protein